MAEVAAFGVPDGEGVGNDYAVQAMLERMTRLSIDSAPPPFDDSRAYLAQEELYGIEGRPLGASTSQQGAPEVPFSSGGGGAAAGGDDRHHGRQWLLLRFSTPVTAPSDALVFGARLELDVHGEQCRLAFFGRLVKTFALSDDEAIGKLKVYKVKERYGVLERLQPDGVSGICRGLFKKQTDLSVFVGLRVATRRGETAVIEGAFGKSGKFRVQFDQPPLLQGRTPDDNQLVLRFKKYVFAEKKDGKAKPVQ
uniref:Ribosome biogenesis protein BMS1/TSR1 C-terminal domain-containing protein n=1 Tax=Chlamydomonas euryale TaxID=1486919 RepID=A0A7R9V1Z7_9CHLO